MPLSWPEAVTEIWIHSYTSDRCLGKAASPRGSHSFLGHCRLPVHTARLPHLSSRRTHRSLNCRCGCFQGGRLRFFWNLCSSSPGSPTFASGDTWNGKGARAATPASGARASGVSTSRAMREDGPSRDEGFLLFSLWAG